MEFVGADVPFLNKLLVQIEYDGAASIKPPPSLFLAKTPSLMKHSESLPTLALAVVTLAGPLHPRASSDERQAGVGAWPSGAPGLIVTYSQPQVRSRALITGSIHGVLKPAHSTEIVCRLRFTCPPQSLVDCQTTYHFPIAIQA